MECLPCPPHRVFAGCPSHTRLLPGLVARIRSGPVIRVLWAILWAGLSTDASAHQEPDRSPYTTLPAGPAPLVGRSGGRGALLSPPLWAFLVLRPLRHPGA